jgi:hypothetical protein
MKSLGKFGGLLGILYCLVGFLLVFLGWNGAASYDRVSAQIPYVVSGGLAGLALVVLGTGLIIVQSHRADRAALEATLLDLRDVLDRLAAGATKEAVAVSASAQAEPGSEVLAGPSGYHRAGCRLIEGQSGLAPMSVAAAEERGLEACRICLPG